VDGRGPQEDAALQYLGLAGAADGSRHGPRSGPFVAAEGQRIVWVLEYDYVFTAQSAGTGTLEAPTHACLCFGGLVTDAAGNKLRKHGLPAAV